MLRRYRYVFIIVLLAYWSSCSYKPPDDPNARPGRGFNIFPTWYDNMMGQQYGELYVHELPILTNTRVEQGVEGLGKQLVRTYYGPEKPPFAFEFHVVNLDVFNAFALPGGKVFVFRGLLQSIENESELAGVISHEMGHAVARHGTKNVSKALLYQGLLTTGVALVRDDHRYLATAAYIGGSIGISLRMLKYSRDYEREADWIAVHNIYKAGYNPQGMVTLFQHFTKIEKEKGQQPAMFLSSHPSPEERKKNVDRELPKLDLQKQWKTEQFGFSQIKSELSRMPPAPKEWKGKRVESLTSLDSLGSVVADGRVQDLIQEQQQKGSQTVRVFVPGNEQWIDTAISVRAGQRIEFHAEGQIQLDASATETTGPAGNSARVGGLVARLQSGSTPTEPIFIGSSNTLEVNGPGHLQLGINDSSAADNAGWYVVTVTIYQ